MTKHLLVAVLLCAATASFGQSIPFGNNKEAGKFYGIRGFKMYCEITEDKRFY